MPRITKIDFVKCRKNTSCNHIAKRKTASSYTCDETIKHTTYATGTVLETYIGSNHAADTLAFHVAVNYKAQGNEQSVKLVKSYFHAADDDGSRRTD